MFQRAVILLLLPLLLLCSCGHATQTAEVSQPTNSAASADSELNPDPSEESTQAVSEPAGEDSSSVTYDPAEFEEENSSLLQLRACIAGSYYACAVAYLGQPEDPSVDGIRSYLEENGFLEEFPFLQEIPEDQIILYDGTELYCIVPQTLPDSVMVRALDFSVDNVPKNSQTLYSSYGLPILLLCNQDGIANTRLFINDSQLEYSPSLTDGVLDVPATGTGVLDFSEYPDALAPIPDVSFVGAWSGEQGCSLFILDTGDVVLTTDTDLYEGTMAQRQEDSTGWICAFDLVSQKETTQWLHCVYHIQADSDTLLLSYTQGDCLYPDAPSSLVLSPAEES